MGRKTGFRRSTRGQMEIPLKEGWDEKIPKSTVYPQGPKERELIDQTFDRLHQQGRMEWSLHHTPSGYPVFVAYRQVPKADGTMESKGRVIVDIRGLNAQTQPVRKKKENFNGFGYKDFCRIYVDGMIVASTSLEEHEAHLRKIKCERQYGLRKKVKSGRKAKI